MSCFEDHLCKVGRLRSEGLYVYLRSSHIMIETNGGINIGNPRTAKLTVFEDSVAETLEEVHPYLKKLSDMSQIQG